MLVLTRKVGEEIIIGDNIRVKIVSIKGDRIRVGIEAPASVEVNRAEIHERKLVPAGACPESVDFGTPSCPSSTDTAKH